MPTIDLYRLKNEQKIEESELHIAIAERSCKGVSKFDMEDFGLYLDNIIREALFYIDSSRYAEIPKGMKEEEWRAIISEMQDIASEISCRQYSLYNLGMVDCDSQEDYDSKSSEFKAEIYAFRMSLYNMLAKYIENMNIYG